MRGEQGPYAFKGYLIKTFAGEFALTLDQGKVESDKPVMQWEVHQHGDQSWIFEEVPMPNVPANLKPDPNTNYKIVSILNKNKALTINQKGEAVLQKFAATDNQKFNIHHEKHKYALVTPNKNALCIFGDKQENDAHVVSDPGKHNSSWFEIVRADKGPFQNRGYIIKTHANGKALDISGGKAIEGKPINQYTLHENGNQVWLIEPFQEEHKAEQAPG